MYYTIKNLTDSYYGISHCALCVNENAACKKRQFHLIKPLNHLYVSTKLGKRPGAFLKIYVNKELNLKFIFIGIVIVSDLFAVTRVCLIHMDSKLLEFLKNLNLDFFYR